MKNKVIIIGLDGVSLDSIEPWLKGDELPNIQNLLQEGLSSEFRSILPIHTASAWTSMLTGRPIDEHGVFDFFELSQHAYQPRFMTALDVNVPYLWELASQQDLKSIVINVPLTHPPRPFNGILIPGLMAPSEPPCYPIGILEEVRSAIGGYQVYWPNEVDDSASFENKVAGFLELSRMRRDAVLYLANKYPWDMLVVQFQRTDSVFHILNKEMGGNNKSKSLNLMGELFSTIDSYIGEIIALDPEATVFVVSDHGMGHTDWMFAVNLWLKQHGYLNTRIDQEWADFEIDTEFARLSDPKSLSNGTGIFEWMLSYLANHGLTKQKIERIVRRYGLEKLILKVVPYKMLKTQAGSESIDWEKSLAFCYYSSGGGILINQQGRQPNGIVEAGEEYEQLCDQLVSSLKQLRDPNGQPAFELVAKRGDLYSGSQIEHIPDIVFLPRDDQYKIEKRIRGNVFVPLKNYYSHKRDGLIIAKGPFFNQKAAFSSFEPTILDLVPNVLCALGQPLDKSMQGRILDNFRDEYLTNLPEPVDYNNEVYRAPGQNESILSTDDQDVLGDHLRALGYLD